MNSRQNKTKKKSHVMRKVLITIVSIIVLLAIVAGVGLMIERNIVKNETDKLAQSIKTEASSSSAVASSSSTASAGTASSTGQAVAAKTPEQVAEKMNSYAATIKAKVGAYVDSAVATVSGSAVTYTIKSSNLNSLTANALVAANGDSIQSLADQALTSMSESGTENPKVDINLTNGSGNIVKSLTYTK